jgi:hypothetical protein
MKIKTTVQFHLLSGTIVLINTPPTTNVGNEVGKRNPHTLLVGMQASTTTLEKKIEASLKLNIDLPYDPAIPLLRINPKEFDLGYSRGTCTPMFIAVLDTIATYFLRHEF